MQFQNYIFVAILLITFSDISVNAKCQNKNEECNCAGDRCEDHCGYTTFIEFPNNKTCCICKAGFARSNTGKCIPIQNCALECASNEIFTNPDSSAESCDYTCKCKPGYSRKNGICVPCVYPREYMARCLEFNDNECSCSKCDVHSKLCKGDCLQNHLHCKYYCMIRCECLICEDGFKLSGGKCIQEKCTKICKQGEILDKKTCTCHVCPIGQIPCNGECVNNPKYCSMFQVNQCKCLKCETGYVLENGDCVPEPQPSCLPNEYYGKYDSSCIATCTNPSPTYCASIIEVGCHCRAGYVLDTTSNLCIRYKNCPPPEPICPENEKYLTCGSACPPTCDVPEPTICTKQCVSGCFCKEGFFRDLNSGLCVQKKNCSCSFVNTQFCLCGPKQPATCNTPFVSDNNCDGDRPGCYCIEGTIRDQRTGQCVQPGQCTCGRAHEVYSTCGTACERSCMKPEYRLCIDLCVPGCFCEDGYVRNLFGDCVLLTECKCPPNEVYTSNGCICRPGYEREYLPDGECIIMSCPNPNEEYNSCGTHCPLTCDNMNPRPCILSCKSGCFCTNGTIRDNDSGLCVKPEKCCKLSDEAYFDCYSEYPNTSECTRGCFCINGKVRDSISGQCVSPDESCDS